MLFRSKDEQAPSVQVLISVSKRYFKHAVKRNRVNKKNIEAKNVGYEKQIKELQEQVDEEKQRTEELNEYKKYVQTKKFAEEIAKDKFGLIYPDEIIFKGKK